MNFDKIRAVSGLVSLWALATASGTWAATGSAKAEASSPGKLEEIVVTAERRQERLQDVPIAVTAITSHMLERTGTMTTQDLNSAVPGLSFTTLSNSAVIFVRGVGTTNPVVGNESSVPVYIDGVYQPSFKGDIFSFNNISRVEVLKGPQGTLFGRNATGGAIQIVTKDPSPTFSVTAGAAYESHDTVVDKLYITGGVAKNLAADLAVFYDHQMGNLGRDTVTGDPIGMHQQTSFRSKWLWRPSDDTTITFSGQYMQSKGSDTYTYQFLPFQTGIDGVTKYDGNPYDSQTTRDPYGWVKQRAESLRIEHDFSAVRLVSITGDNDTHSYYYYEPDNVPADIENAYLYATENAQSEELQLLSDPASKAQWIAGAFYFHDSTNFPIRLTGAALTPLTYLTRNSHGKVDSYSIFGQLTYPIFTDTKLTLGARANWDDLGYQGTEGSSFGTLIPYVSDHKFHKQPTYRASLEHKFAPDIMGYISFNRGYKSGTFNLIDVPTEPATRPETLNAYEIGTKAQLFDHRLRINAAAFYYDYKNLQVLVNEGSIAVESNAPAAEIYGLDLDGEALVVKNLTARIGLSVLHDEFTDYPNAAFYTPAPGGGAVSLTGANCPAGHPGNASGCSAEGNQLPRVPSWTVDFGFTYDRPIPKGDLAFTVSEYINGGFYWDADNYAKQGLYNTLSMDLTWRLPGDQWSFRVYGRNLTDDHYYDDVQENGFGFFGNVIAPRTVGAEVDFHY